MNACKKILKLTPESSRYLSGVGDSDKNGGKGTGMVNEERNPTPAFAQLCAWRARGWGCGGNRCPARPLPPARVPTGSGLPALPAPPFINRTDNKRRVGAERWGRGTQSLPSPSESGDVSSPLAPPFQFLRLSEGDPRTRSSRYQSPDNAHGGTVTHTHVCTQNQVHGDTHSASPLPPKQPSDGANRGERGSPALLPWKSPCSHRQPPPPSSAPPRRSPSAGRSGRADPAAEPARRERSAGGRVGEAAAASPRRLSPTRPRSGLFLATSQP